jgi:hypothetical protein
VALKLSGEYWSNTSVPRSRGRRSLIHFAPRTAMAMISSFDFPNTTRRWAGEVLLYKWITQRREPTSEVTVRSIKSSRACTSTCTVTSFGTWFSSMRRRLNANSVFDAAGKPISISLNPQLVSAWNILSFCSTFIGSCRAWLPSRKSTEHQIGAWVSTRPGHCRSAMGTGGKGRYFDEGLENMCVIKSAGRGGIKDRACAAFRPKTATPAERQ